MNSIDRTLKILREKEIKDSIYFSVVHELASAMNLIIDKHPEYEKENIFGRLMEAEKVLEFSVPWRDDAGEVHVNRGYRVQFNSVLGPYKGGFRFHPSVDLDLFKALALEQTLKNALTGLPMGGAKGGSDFNPKGKSDTELMRFCQSFMLRIFSHIGENIDIPAGDIGVGNKEIGYMYGMLKNLRGKHELGALTGKQPGFGGSLIRPESTGYGICYFAQFIERQRKGDLRDKRVVISGYGNVAWGVAKKMEQLGAKVVTLSGSDGYIYDEAGICGEEKLNFLLTMRTLKNRSVKEYSKRFSVPYYPAEKPWGVQGDIYIPCATQNEICYEDAKKIAQNKGSYMVEGSNIPCTSDAQNYFIEQDYLFIPSKAANAGGVSVSFLEMSQNAQLLMWSERQVDRKLKEIMSQIFDNLVTTKMKYSLSNYVLAANISALERLSRAEMIYQYV